jgi:hypothetical protein
MKTITEKMYGSRKKLLQEESYDLVDKIDLELQKIGYIEVECCCCENTTRMTLEDAKKNELAPKGEQYYCGCADK